MPSSRVSAQIVVPLTLVAGLAVLLAIVPLPGSLSVLSTRWLGSVGARVPGIEVISEAGLLLLAAATAAALAHAWWRDAGKRPRVVVAGAGVVLAYLLSEGERSSSRSRGPARSGRSRASARLRETGRSLRTMPRSRSEPPP
ncbi:hypothetical protein [Microbacterium oxydans]|uniref:hypothetical protein n=1 Tax=Microbacterium oxydans TaxID=82380 RepID=UPI00226BA938|nr:hypothetical protein [Microbacterium oxydans]WAA67988.1 hypothetical protein MME74_10485 [Microbacterium oxydans]